MPQDQIGNLGDGLKQPVREKGSDESWRIAKQDAIRLQRAISLGWSTPAIRPAVVSWPDRGTLISGCRSSPKRPGENLARRSPP
jgi:hypothetical protein